MTNSRDNLLRTVGGVLLCYIIFALAALGGTLAIHAAIPVDDLLAPQSFAPTPLFAGLQVGLALAASLAAGAICRRIAGSRRPAYALASMLFVLNFFHALTVLSAPSAGPVSRTGAESADEFHAQVLAHQPAWLTVGLPIAVLAGVLLGNRLGGRGRPS